MRFLFIFIFTASLFLQSCTQTQPSPIEDNKARQDIADVLDRYYEAVGKADFDGFITLFAESAEFYGTDATEIWPFEQFAPSIKENFSGGVGWDFDLIDRRISVSQAGDTAWFAELSHFKNTDYLLRPTGVMEKHDGKWKIVQIVMGIPIPNLLYPPVLQGMQATDLGKEVETDKINAVLDHLHEHAANAEGEAYFSLYSDDAIFLGTDVTERWTKTQFQAYANPIFGQGRGWRYTPRERRVILSPMSNMAWFDEVLDSKNYGTSRGTGVLTRTRDGWKISQYHLTFPIPNDLADDMTKQIMAYERDGK